MSTQEHQAVIDYWNNNPVHSVEFKDNTDFMGYIDKIDELRWSDNEKWAEPKFYDLPEWT
jgi:hypothetical protein